MSKVYIASGLENAPKVQGLRDTLLTLGISLTYDWTLHGSVQSGGSERMAEVSQAEMEGVTSADLVVAVLPGGRGTHIEIGIALGAGVPVLLAYSDARHLGDASGHHCAFYHHAGVMWSCRYDDEGLANEVWQRLCHMKASQGGEQQIIKHNGVGTCTDR